MKVLRYSLLAQDMNYTYHYISSSEFENPNLMLAVPSVVARVSRCPFNTLAAWHPRPWVRVMLDNPLHPLTHPQPNQGTELRPTVEQWAKHRWFGWGGGTFMWTDWGIPIWKAVLILNFPEGISAGWCWSLKEILGGCNLALDKAQPERVEQIILLSFLYSWHLQLLKVFANYLD